MISGRKESSRYEYRIYKSGAVELDSPRKWMFSSSSTTFSSLEEAKTNLTRKDKNLNRIGYALLTTAYLGGFTVLGGGLDTAFFHQLTNYDHVIMLGGLGIAVATFTPLVPTAAYHMRVREQLNVMNDLQNTPTTDLPSTNQ